VIEETKINLKTGNLNDLKSNRQTVQTSQTFNEVKLDILS